MKIILLSTLIFVYSCSHETLESILKKYEGKQGMKEIEMLLAQGMSKTLTEAIKIGDNSFEKGDNALMISLFFGYNDLSESLIENHINIFVVNSYGQNALHYAAAGSKGDIIKFLLKKGFDVNAKSYNNQTPLTFAIYHGNEEAAKVLIDNKADVNHTDKLKQSLVSLSRNVNMLNMLIAHGAIVDDSKTENGETPLILASSFGNTEVVKVLVKYTSDINAKDTLGRTAFLLAAANGHVEVMKILVENKAEINIIDNEGTHPMMYAAYNGNIDAINFFITHGVSPNTTSNANKQTPLMLACYRGHYDAVKLLLPYTDNINYKDRAGQSALTFAAGGSGNISIIDTLIKSGATINCTDNQGNTPLIHAAYFNKLQAVKFLLEQGALIDRKNNAGYTAADFCENIRNLTSEANKEDI